MSGGAWGLGLFQSDYDYDIIQELNQEAGIWILEKDDAKHQSKTSIYAEAIEKTGRGEESAQHVRNVEHERADEAETKKQPSEIFYSIYAGLCSDPKRVKEYLQRTGMLNTLIRNRLARLSAPNANKDTFRPGYVVIMLGACAMSLGCDLDVGFFEHLRISYAHRTRVGLMRDAITQMGKALFGPGGYSNGQSYDFGSKSLNATVAAGGPAYADRYFPTMINVPSPSGALPQELLAQALVAGNFDNYELTAQYLMKRFEMAKGEVKVYGKDECGGCGAKGGSEGEAMAVCDGCKGRRYCSKECQRKDWPKHKVVCKVGGWGAKS